MREPLVSIENVSKSFKLRGGAADALESVSARIERGGITGLVGPDGAGKTTLIRLIAGLMRPDSGTIRVDGYDSVRDAETLHRNVIGYMPQRFGLYEDLSVLENLTLHARLRGLAGTERVAAFDRLLGFTGLASFTKRLAGALSGGMKQKLGLACALLRPPTLLLLDEPGVGVDPMARRDLWAMVQDLAGQGIGIVWSTAYLDEAERCPTVIVLHAGSVVHQGAPADLTRIADGRAWTAAGDGFDRRDGLAGLHGRPQIVDSLVQGDRLRIVTADDVSDPREALARLLPTATIAPVPARFEDAFMIRLQALGGEPLPDLPAALDPPALADADVVRVDSLTRRFGTFTAVDKVSFTVRRGEIYGLLGPNGAGKSTTFKMMCGLLPPSDGNARVAGIDLRRARSAARQNIGYMAQKFSLYGQLSVRQNLAFFARAYGLTGKRRSTAIDAVVGTFGLGPVYDRNAGDLPLGFRQRLSLACALLHAPPLLFLDEPTSGVDPLTRREFWSVINTMVRRGTTVVVTTHFMEEAEYCDRVALIYRGRKIAEGTPDALKTRWREADGRVPTLEEAFIREVEAQERAA